MTCGIYSITNKKTGQKYIGLSVNIEKRWKEHSYSNKSYIDKALTKYGINNFSFEIIEEVPKNLLSEREKYWIAYFDTYNNPHHYNLTPGGDIPPSIYPNVREKISKSLKQYNKTHKRKPEDHPMYGRKHSQKAKDKISKANKGKNNGMYGKKGKLNPSYGRKHSKESRRKMSESRKGEKNHNFGKPMSDETKKKLSDAQKGEKSHMWGKHLPYETRLKISLIQNSSGYFRVYKKKDKNVKQGFRWTYKYYVDGKKKYLSSVDLDKLKSKVLDKGLEWIEF